MINCQKANVHSARKNIHTSTLMMCGVGRHSDNKSDVMFFFQPLLLLLLLKSAHPIFKSKIPALGNIISVEICRQPKCDEFYGFLSISTYFQPYVTMRNLRMYSRLKPEHTHTHTEAFSLAFQWPPPPASE